MTHMNFESFPTWDFRVESAYDSSCKFVSQAQLQILRAQQCCGNSDNPFQADRHAARGYMELVAWADSQHQLFSDWIRMRQRMPHIKEGSHQSPRWMARSHWSNGGKGIGSCVFDWFRRGLIWGCSGVLRAFFHKLFRMLNNRSDAVSAQGFRWFG